MHHMWMNSSTIQVSSVQSSHECKWRCSIRRGEGPYRGWHLCLPMARIGSGAPWWRRWLGRGGTLAGWRRPARSGVLARRRTYPRRRRRGGSWEGATVYGGTRLGRRPVSPGQWSRRIRAWQSSGGGLFVSWRLVNVHVCGSRGRTRKTHESVGQNK